MHSVSSLAGVVQAGISPPDPQLEEQIWFTSSASGRVEAMHARNSPREWAAWRQSYSLWLVHSVHEGMLSRPQGTATLRYRGSEHEVSANVMLLLEPNHHHVVCHLADKFMSFDAFEIDPEAVHQAAAALGLPTPVRLKTVSTRDPLLRAATRRFAECMSTQVDASECKRRLHGLLGVLLRRHAEGSRTTDLNPPCKVQVARAVNYIVAHHAESFSLDDLASACGASKSTISHALPKALGATPVELRTVVRVSRAKQMLRDGVSPNQVAVDVGFFDQSQLTRCFRRAWGITPARYARMVRATATLVR